MEEAGEEGAGLRGGAGGGGGGGATSAGGGGGGASATSEIYNQLESLLHHFLQNPFMPSFPQNGAKNF